MGKNGYLQKQKIRDAVYQRAATDTERQYLVDLLCLVLNDPEAMGKDTFGKVRIQRVVNRLLEEYDTWNKALGGGPEADYYQERMDAALGRILGPDLVPFKMRYDWLKEASTVKKKG